MYYLVCKTNSVQTYWVVLHEDAYNEHPEGVVSEKNTDKEYLEELAADFNNAEQDALADLHEGMMGDPDEII